MGTQSNRPGALRINGTGLPGGTAVELDDHDITHALTGVSLRVGVGCDPTATLDVVLHDLSADTADTRIVVPDDTRALLARLGWTPPEGEAADAVH